MTKLLKIDEEINKDFPNTVLYSNSLQRFTIPRMSSNIFIFDLLSNGGIPLNKIIKVWGAKSTGKSSFVLRLAGIYQQLNPDKYVLILDYEKSYDPKVAKCLLYDINRVRLVTPDYGEQGIDIHRKYLEAKEIGFVVVDSIASMTPLVEAEASASQDHVGNLSKLVNKMFRITNYATNVAQKQGRDITTVFINQVRSLIGGGRFGGFTTPGGNMQEHLPTMEIRLSLNDKQPSIKAKRTYKFTINKNRGYLQKVTGIYSVYITDYKNKKIGDIDELRQVISYARRMGIIKKNKGNYDVAGKQFTSLAAVGEVLENEAELFEKIKKATLDICLKQNILGKGENNEEE